MGSQSSAGLRLSRLLPLVAAILLCLVVVPRLIASPSDTIAERVLGQTDLTHSTSPSFVRKKSLSLVGNPRGGTGVAVDQSGGHIYVADHNSNRVLGWNSVASF